MPKSSSGHGNVLPIGLEEAIARIPSHGLVLDVGGASRPLGRADWVIDICPYRGYDASETKDGILPRFSRETWVQRDVCGREPWPFSDKQFDFVFCSHILEDIRDPVWVCSEMSRVGKAGYVEVPSRERESTRGIELRWELPAQAGNYHHRWLIELVRGELVFLMKPAFMHGSRLYAFPRRFRRRWAREGKDVLSFLWQERISVREEIVLDFRSFQAAMREFVAERAGRNLHMLFYDRVFMPCRRAVLWLRRKLL